MINKTESAALKAARRMAREEEIRLHGKPICWRQVVESKKTYNRKSKHKPNYLWKEV